MNATTTLSPGRRLRLAWNEKPLQVPGVFCGLVARLAERAGFQAVYLSGAALSASLALPDVGLVTQTEFVEFARTLTRATSLPVISDADTGFGEALSIERTVQLFEEARVAGIHLEDQEMPKRCGHLSGKALIEPSVMAARVRAAVRARRDPDFVLIARTDARSVHGFADAVDRAKRYLDAGADVIFPEALENELEFEEFAKAIPAPLLANMTEFGKSPNMDYATLAAMGYRIVLYPVTVFRSALRAAEETLAALLRDGHQRDVLGRMLTRQELYDLLDYRGYEERDRAFFGSV